jgi:hypothetical protein
MAAQIGLTVASRAVYGTLFSKISDLLSCDITLVIDYS